MKILRKNDLLTKREAGFFMEEKEALILGKNAQWLTQLYMSFQDQNNLYLIMEFVAGGSLKALIDLKDEPMDELDAKFYVAEMIMGIEEVHSLGFIHR
jgi:serine/threonine protein kinase